MIEFAAVVALTGVLTRGGWYLAPLEEEGGPVPRSRDLPLPVTGQQQEQDRAPGQQGPQGWGVQPRIGWLEHLRYMQGAVVGRGFLDNTRVGRDYAGSLSLGLTRIVMEGETSAWSYPDDDFAEYGGPEGPVCCTDWRVSGASVQVAPAWDLPPARIELRGLL